MPYIKQSDREKVDNLIDQLVDILKEQEKRAGACNYTVSRLLSSCYGENKVPDNWSYLDINEVVGVLECAKLEFYRRVGVPKEDKAIYKNGDLREYNRVPYAYPKNLKQAWRKKQ